MDFFVFLVMGLLAGWLAGKVMKGRGFGLFGDIGVGIVGAYVGGFLFRALGFGANGFLARTIVAFFGSVCLLAIAGLIGRPREAA